MPPDAAAQTESCPVPDTFRCATLRDGSPCLGTLGKSSPSTVLLDCRMSSAISPQGRTDGRPRADAARFGRFELRSIERQLLDGGRQVAIGARAFDVLQLLIERRDRVVSKAELLDAVWPGLFVEENNLTVQVSALRKILGPQAIATIPGRGYRFVVQLHGDATPPPETAALPFTSGVAGLPVDLPGLVGRQQDLAALAALLRVNRLVTVIGAGGIGKTRLVQWTLRAAERRAAAWVELSACVEASQLPAAIARASGVQLGAGEPVQGLVAALASHNMLLALDNAEHMVADVAAVVQALQQGAPALRMLVTSQAPLRLQGEALLRLDALSLPVAGANVEAGMQSGAVALFVQRAQAARPNFALDEGNVAAVIDLCRRLDGMPLALELAAARMGALGIHELAQLLDARLRILRRDQRGAPARHQTLHAALDWSHALLAETEKRVFRHLSVFVGQFTLEAARRAASDDAVDEWAVIDALGVLVDRSLVAVEHGEPTRYRMLDTPRLYALERLAAAGEAEARRQRHAKVTQQMFEQADARYLDGLQPVDTWRDVVSFEVDDGLTAWRWALEHDDLDCALSLTARLDSALASLNAPRSQRRVLWDSTIPWIDSQMVSLEVRERWLRGVVSFGPPYAADPRWTDRLWAVADAQQARPDQRAAYVSLRYAMRPLTALAPVGRQQQAKVRAAIETMRMLEDPKWPAVVRGLRARAEGEVCRHQGEYTAAVEWFERTAALAREAGDTRGAHSGRTGAIDTKLIAGRFDDAVEDSTALIAALRDTSDEATLALAMLNMCTALVATRRGVEARAVMREVWLQAERFSFIDGLTDLLALLLAIEGDAAGAARLLGSRLAQSGGKPLPRQVTEQRAVDEAEQIIRRSLGDAQAEALLQSGIAMTSQQIRRMIEIETPTGGH